jgi:hypothetical protein
METAQIADGLHIPLLDDGFAEGIPPISLFYNMSIQSTCFLNVSKKSDFIDIFCFRTARGMAETYVDPIDRSKDQLRD